jgi:hypothetical protein
LSRYDKLKLLLKQLAHQGNRDARRLRQRATARFALTIDQELEFSVSKEVSATAVKGASGQFTHGLSYYDTPAVEVVLRIVFKVNGDTYLAGWKLSLQAISEGDKFERKPNNENRHHTFLNL